jgi:HEAT repeat protein
MQISAIFAMGRSGDKRWRNIILSELESSDARLRFEAARAAGELELAEAVQPLIQLIQNDPDSEVQQNAVWSLGQIGGPEAKAMLEQLIDSTDEALQTTAEDALDELILMSGDPEEMFSYTIDMDDDEDEDIHIVDFGQNGHGDLNDDDEED